MASVLISDKGRELAASGAALGFLLDYPRPDFDIVAYAVRNCGWLHLRWSRRLLRIRLRPQGFSRAAYNAAVARMLEVEKGTRFVFDHEDGELGTDVLLNLNDAIAHLEDLMSFAGETSARTSFFAEELSLGRLKHPKRRVLRDLIIGWKRERGLLPDDVAAPFREIKTAERFIIASASQRRCTVAQWGSGISAFGDGWSERAVGRELEEQPDGRYGERSAESYHEVFRTERPRFELVDAVIRPADGRPVQRCRYERLLLPWRTGSGEMFVSGTSYLRTRFHFPA